MCHLCHQPIDYSLDEGPECFEPDHYYPVSTHKHLEHDPGNLRASHQKCNRSRGDTPIPETKWVTADDW